MATAFKKINQGCYEAMQIGAGAAIEDPLGKFSFHLFQHVEQRGGTPQPSGSGRCIFALIASPNVQTSVNGKRVVAGMRVLRHKDEINVGPDRWILSTESRPIVETFTADDDTRPAKCPICRKKMETGQLAVRCPGCSRIFHQMGDTADSPAKMCWTYSDRCKFCHHPTSLGAEMLWHPQVEDQL